MSLLEHTRASHGARPREQEASHRRERRTHRLAVVVVVAAIASTWLLSGVSVGEASRFTAFELLYVLLPGVLLYAVLAIDLDGWLRTVAIGAPLGYAINIGAFALTAGLGSRAAFAFLPLAAIGTMGPLSICRHARVRQWIVRRGLRGRARAPTVGGHHQRGDRARHRRGSSADRRSLAGPESMIVAIALAAALLLLAVTFFASSPLPGLARSVVYSADNVFDISLAAEARNHWPITEPWVAGQPLHYYTGVFIHAAAVNQVAGVPLSTVILRLLPTTMFLVVALQLWLLGESLRDSRWVGPLAVLLLLVVEDVNLNPTRSQVFKISPFTQFPLSPSFAFGAPFLLGVLALLGPRFAEVGLPAPRGVTRDSAVARANTVGTLAIMGILVTGAAAAKMFAAVDLLGGLGLYWLWNVIAGRPSRLAFCCTALSAICVSVVYLTMLAGGGASSVSLSPLNFVHEGDSFARARTLAEGAVGHTLYWLPLVAGAAILAALLFAPLLGGVWLLRKRAIPASGGLAACVFVTGLLSYALLGAPGGVEGVFLVYGYIAVVPLAALGLLRLWEDTPTSVRGGLLTACGGLLATGLAIAAVTPRLALTGRAADAWYALAYGSIAAGIALTVGRLRKRYAGVISSRVGAAVACGIPLLIALGMVKPTALAASGAWKTITRQRIAQPNSPSDYGLTGALYAGLLWVRDHTGRCDVLAVSNHFSGPGGSDPDYVYYSAFAERRVFLESWFYTPVGARGGAPYRGRLALNNRAISGNSAALRELARDGVSYVLIDRIHGADPHEPPSVTRLVFANSALDVYRLGASGIPTSSKRPCASVT